LKTPTVNSGVFHARAASFRGPRRGGAAKAFLAPAMFLLPTLIAIVVLRLVPTISAVGTSLVIQPPGGLLPGHFAGVGNYLAIIQDPGFQKVIAVTLLFNLVINPLQTGLALVLANLLVRRVRFSAVLRIVLFLPICIPAVGSTIVWGILFQPHGPINGVLNAIGIPSQPFLTSPGQALGSIIIICSWVGIGYLMTFLITGLQAVPEELYEAAILDRAGPLRTFFSVTIPMLRRTILFVLVADTVANFVVFVPVQLLTLGGPDGSTDLLMYDSYFQTFSNGELNTGAAQIVVLLAIMLIIVSIQFRLLRSDVES
jgi:multiple sugar transport system permease protein